MPRKNKKRNKQKSLEKQIEALTISSSTAAQQQQPPQSPASPSPPPPPPTKLSTSSSSSSCTTPTPTCITSKDLTSQLRSAIHGRESFDALVTKHIFDKLKKSRISKDQIVDILLETGCPLDFALLMENAEVIRSMLERCQRDIPKKESCILVELAMRMPYLENLKPLVRYGPGAKCRRDMFFAQMFDMVNRQGADLTSARRYIEKLVNADVIDEYTMQFLEKTFEVGNEEAIRMLLDMKIDDYVRRKFGDDMLVHLFGNVNVDALEILRGRRFNVNAKCGDMAALHFATLSRLEKNVRILLNSGADPDVRDCHDNTPLFAFGDDKCITLLLHNGADIQAIADNGYTILHMIFAPNLQGILLAHIALIEARGTTIRKELRDKIVSNAAFVDFYDKACKQIEDMRSCRIHDDFNLWTALVRNPETIARFVNCQETVDELICECRHMQMHSYYLATLERNFVRAFSVYGLRCKAVEKLVKVFELVGLDEMIVERIVEYLEFEDLIVFA